MEAQTDSTMASRLDFVKAIKSSPHNNPRGACDYVPAMELVGVLVAHAAVTKMHAEGKLDAAPTALLNAALCLHSFNVWHCCSHEALGSHNDEHEAFENMVTRLSGWLIRTHDALPGTHKRHHRYTNSPDDPDLWMMYPLPLLGKTFQGFFGMARGDEPPPLEPGTAYKDFAMQAFTDQVLKNLAANEDTKDLANSLRTALGAAGNVYFVILVLFFGRYPHLKANAKTGEGANEVNNFYDTTWRGQGQVDLWMMGEGWHHGHHAVTDVNYSVLPKVGADVEETHPEIKKACRGNDDILSLEDPSKGGPPLLASSTSEPCQRGWERTLAVRAELDKFVAQGGSPAAVKDLFTNVARIVIDNALYVVTAADAALLRHIHHGMGLEEEAESPANPLPFGQWHKTVFSTQTQKVLAEQSGLIRTGVLDLASAAGSATGPVRMSQLSDMKKHYLEFYKGLGRALVDEQKYWRVLGDLATSLSGRKEDVMSGDLEARIRKYLESPLYRESTRLADMKRPVGSPKDVPQLIGSVLGVTPPASRL